jgi:Malic enzyme, NAD binding domain
MIMAVAEALPRMLSDEERKRRAVYPDLGNIRNISANMAVEVPPLAPLSVSDALDGRTLFTSGGPAKYPP